MTNGPRRNLDALAVVALVAVTMLPASSSAQQQELQVPQFRARQGYADR